MGRRASEGRFVSDLDNSKTSPWNDVVNKTMFNNTRKGKYNDLSMKNKMLMKIQTENLLPKGSGGDQPEGEKNHKKGGLNCVFGNFFFYVLDNCPQVQSLK